MALTLTVGDTAPTLTGTVNANLTNAVAVKVHIKRPDGTVIDEDATVVSAAAGTWSYDWAEDDLNRRGPYLVEVEVTFSNEKIQTFAYDSGTPVQFNVRDQYDIPETP